MSAVLGCPARSVAPPALSVEEACRKLALCGVLADKYMVGRSDDTCTLTEECANRENRDPGGECLANAKGEWRCHYHHLDYFWCVQRLSEPGGDPCDAQAVRFTTAHVEAVVACIGATPCNVLGASLSEKLGRHDVEGVNVGAETDRYLCKKDGRTTIWTATACDYGLLRYDSRTPPTQ